MSKLNFLILISLFLGCLITALSFFIPRHNSAVFCAVGANYSEGVREHGLPLVYYTNHYSNNENVCSDIYKGVPVLKSGLNQLNLGLDVLVWFSLSALTLVVIKELEKT